MLRSTSSTASGVQRHEVARRLHRRAEARELADADHFARLDRRELEQQPLGKRQRALGADEQAGEVVAACGVGLRREGIDVVAADAAQLAREAGGDLVGLADAECAQRGKQRRRLLRIGGTEAMARTVGEQRVDREHVVGHQPVADALGTAGIVAGHAADGAALVRRGIDREEEAVRLQRRVEMAEHEAGLDQRGARGGIDLDDLAQVLRAVEHDRPVDRLPALAGAAAARQHRHAVLAGDRQRRLQVVSGLGNDHADRLDLVRSTRRWRSGRGRRGRTALRLAPPCAAPPRARDRRGQRGRLRTRSSPMPYAPGGGRANAGRARFPAGGTTTSVWMTEGPTGATMEERQEPPDHPESTTVFAAVPDVDCLIRPHGVSTHPVSLGAVRGDAFSAFSSAEQFIKDRTTGNGQSPRNLHCEQSPADTCPAQDNTRPRPKAKRNIGNCSALSETIPPYLSRL